MHARSVRSALAVAAGACLLAACSSTGSSSTATTSAQTTTAPTTASATATTATATARPAVSELKTGATSLGTVVTDGAGMTLYMFTKDTQGTTTSACTGACLTAWPLVVADAAPKLTGVTGTVGSIPTADGHKQVTLNGWPLYYYAKDARPGDVTGQNVNQVWFVLTPAGAPVKS